MYKFEQPATPEDVSAVKRIIDAQVHRGPHGEGIITLGDSSPSRLTPHVSRPSVILGHRRLSIIDLSPAGKQPMSNEEGTVWVTYNGEIYNFRELHKELDGRGHVFKSQTDTEVLVHGYEEWGMDELLSRIRGMFAFALCDIGRRSSPSSLTLQPPRFYLAKDRFGIKPLYYYQDRERIIFASEVRAVMKSGMVPNEKNMEALSRFFQLGSVPVPVTTIKDVMALHAGHYLSVGENRVELKSYWDLSTYLHQSPSVSTQSPTPHFESPSTTIHPLLEDSIRHHLISDVPLGIFLSGGIDSSSLVALATGFRDKPLTTLSVIFDEPDYNEARYARLIAKKYGTDHREVLLRSKELFEGLPQIFDAMDQPTVDGVNTYFISKAAREAGLTVVLSGTGGDELFLGYDHFKKTGTLASVRRFLNLLPLWMRKTLIRAAVQAGLPVGSASREKLTYLETPSDENSYLLFRGLFTPREIQDVLGASEPELKSFILQPTTSNLQPSTSSFLLNLFTLFEFRHYLQNQLLKDTDVMSMAHSIETRVPFLDHKLVEYVIGLSPKTKLGNGINKPLLVKAMGEGLPREIWDRQKMGFTFPFEKWMKVRNDELKARCLETKILNRKAVKAVWKAFGKNRTHWSRPWATLVASQAFL